MPQLSNLSIARRISLGFGVTLLITAGMAGMTIFDEGKFDESFQSFAGMAHDASVADTLDLANLNMQLQVREFIATGEEQELREARQGIAGLRERLEVARREIQKPERAAMVRETTQQAEGYVRGFDRVAELMARRDRLVRDSLDTAGLKMREALTGIAESALRDNDAQASALAGRVQERVLLARLGALRFLNTNDAASAARVRAELAEAAKQLDGLDAALQNPERRQLLQQAREGTSAYGRIFADVVGTITERNGIRDGEMRRAAQAMSDRTRQVRESVEADEKRVEAAVKEEMGSALTHTIAGSAIALLLGVLAAWLIARSITVPVNEMTEATGRLAKGDLDAEVPGVGRGDEIGRMARAVEVLKAGAIERRRLEAGQAEAAARAAAERSASLQEVAARFEAKVGAMVATVSSAATELQATAGSMEGTAGRTNEQAASVAASAQQASANVQTVAAAAEELTASVAEITRQVSQSAQMATRAAADARRTDGIVQALAEGAQRVGDVVGLVTSIAGQTNLLALNATIAAARAGEHGKGFAVVASEVKTLAQQTAKATEEISGQIARMQEATREAVEAIRGIGGAIDELNGVSTMIAAAVEEQGAATAEIARNVQQAAGGTEAVDSGIRQVNQAATETGAAAGQVLGAAGELSRQAEQLTAEVQGFVAGLRAA